MFKVIKPSNLLLILSLILVACQAPPATAEPVVETLVVTELVEATPVEVIQVVTPTPEPEGPRTLVICLSLGQEPDTLNNIRGGERKILEAIYDGTVWGFYDSNSYSYQPVLLEKSPSLADGDATLLGVTVREGDTVVDAYGEVVVLDANINPSIMLMPAGGGEPIQYQGGEFQMDQLSATYYLLPDLKWSDGTPLTAFDSVYGFNLKAEIGNLVSDFYVQRTASYEASDDLTTVWTGLPGFLDPSYATSFFSPAPEHLWGKYSTEELLDSEEFILGPVGWGPYMVSEWVQGESITLFKNPNYFRAGEGLPKFDKLIFRFIGENTNANIAALLAGECDIVSASLDDQFELLLDLQADGQIKAPFTPIGVWEHIDFGIQPREYDDGYQLGVDRPDFFSDVRTRQAFAMCMDRQALIDEVLFGQSFVLDSYIPPQHPLYTPDVIRYEFDVQTASALLEEVGWVDDDGDSTTPRVAQGVTNVLDGTPLEVNYETTSAPIRQQGSAIIKDSLSQCGIKVNVQFYSPSEWFADPPDGKLLGRHFDLGQFAWITDAEAWCGFWFSFEIDGPKDETWISIMDGKERAFADSRWSAQNNTGFVNEEFDQACTSAYTSLPDQPAYLESHHEAQRIFAEQLPVVPLFPRLSGAIARPDMCGFILDPTGREMWNIEEFDYGEGCEK